MRPFPARMIDEQGVEMPQEYETLGGDSELTPLNVASDTMKPVHQKLDADGNLEGIGSASAPAALHAQPTLALGLDLLCHRAAKELLASWDTGRLGAGCCSTGGCCRCHQPRHIQERVQIAVSAGKQMVHSKALTFPRPCQGPC